MATETRWGKGSRHDDPIRAREHILMATYKVVTSKGIGKTTIAEIAKQAKVSRPTIYRYFDSRDDIVQSLLASRQDHFFLRMQTATKSFRGDFPRLVEECLCYAQQTTTKNRNNDLVAGSNAGQIKAYFENVGSKDHWANILDEPYRQYRQKTGNVVDLQSLKGFLGIMILTIRMYPFRNHETLRNQLQAVMALGKSDR
ncbi:MAG: AcrR family transcriptional regulator [Bermanella sp.]|jgi:AcrR family transcriptional regulator